MDLNSKDLLTLCKIASNAAIEAGKMIELNKSKAIDLFIKDETVNIASAVVTEIDLHSQKIILKHLVPSIIKYDLGLLTEEKTDDSSRLNKDYFWCIDPLDGTLAYAKNRKGYSVSIALVSKNGDAVIGVVYDPSKASLYTAIKGHGCFKNDLLLKTQGDLKNLTLFFDKSYEQDPRFSQHIQVLRDNLEKFGLKSLSLNPQGGAVMNAIGTIENSPAIYYKIPKISKGGGSLWDFAASSIIQKEAGGYNSNYFFKKLNLNKNESTFMNKEGIIYSSTKDLSELVIKLVNEVKKIEENE